MAAVAAALVALGSHAVPTALLLVAWGFFGTAAPVGWGTWLARTLPDEAETGGGLQVAVIQFAHHRRGGVRRLLFDAVGWQATFGLLQPCSVCPHCSPPWAWRKRWKDPTMRPSPTTIHRRALLVALLAVPVHRPSGLRERGRDPVSQEPTDMRIRVTFAERSLEAVLYDNPTARDLVSLFAAGAHDRGLLDQREDRPPAAQADRGGQRPLRQRGGGRPLLLRPLGNLALFHAGYRYSRGLIRIGRFETSHDALLTKGEFSVIVKRSG